MRQTLQKCTLGLVGGIHAHSKRRSARAAVHVAVNALLHVVNARLSDTYSVQAACEARHGMALGEEQTQIFFTATPKEKLIIHQKSYDVTSSPECVS